MPKEQFIDPEFIRKGGVIKFTDIPVNAYNRTIEEEKASFSIEDFGNIFYDMRVIREFESAIDAIKSGDGYRGIKHAYHGPAHLCIGQEAAAVGQAFVLDRDDMIFGSHRAHGELLARGMRAIRTYSEDELLKIMESYLDGEILRAVEGQNSSGNIRDLAKDFYLYGALAEIFVKRQGFQRGMSGSMHLFFAPFGVYPNNAIVGASAPIAAGAALYKKVRKENGIVVANIGDGALGCGVVYEAMNFAAMDQYRLLWENSGGLPMIFAVSDNGYGMGGQTRGETMSYDFLARLGAGISPTQLYAERIDGNNPLAVIDAFRRKKPLAKQGDGPILLDIVTYRLEGHSNSDKSSYRDDDEVIAWKAHDPLVTYPKQLADAGLYTQNQLDRIANEIVERTEKICRLAACDTKSPYIDFATHPDYLEKLLFANTQTTPTGKGFTLIPIAENSRVKEINTLSRSGLDGQGKLLPDGKAVTVRDGIFEAVLHRFYQDEKLISYGEEVREWGGVCGVYRGLAESLPYERLFNSPISEAAIVSTAIGYAMSGGRVIIEIMFADFMARAADEIFNQLAKWQGMSAGEIKLPIVLRVSVGAKYGSQHSQDWSGLAAHIPGLKVVYPATPYDCKGLMNAALAGDDPVIFFESQRLYDKSEIFHKGGVPRGYYEIPIGEPDIKRTGADITIFTIGATLYRAMSAAEKLERLHGISAEVVDARSIAPFNYHKLLESVKKTGRVIFVGDGAERGSVMKEFSSNVSEACFEYLKSAPVVLGGKNSVIPPYEYDEVYFMQEHDIIESALGLIGKSK
ncbi:MAG: thiamine pyrophosphate-dependent enzyme [Clostridia bacterium]